MALNKKTVDDINAKGKRVLVRCDFNVPLKAGEITDDTRIKAALPTIKKLLNDGGKVILCSHLGKVKNGPNEGESLAPVAKRLEELLGQKVNFVSDYNVTGEAATKAVEEMKEGEVVLLQNTRFRGAEETKNGEQFSKELADLADIYVCDAFGSSHRAHASVAGVTKFITAKGGQNVVGYLMEKEIAFLGNAVENPVRPFVAILGGSGSGVVCISGKNPFCCKYDFHRSLCFYFVSVVFLYQKNVKRLRGRRKTQKDESDFFNAWGFCTVFFYFFGAGTDTGIFQHFFHQRQLQQKESDNSYRHYWQLSVDTCTSVFV